MRSALAAKADPEFAAGVKKFFVEPVQPLGVRSVDLKPIEQVVYRELKSWLMPDRLRFCDELWKGGVLEEGVIVSHVLRRFSRGFGRIEFQQFERWIDRYIHNWAHCDGVSSWLVAGAIANDPSLRASLLRWTNARSRWKRRAAAVSFLQEGKRGRSTEEIFIVADKLCHDADVMVQKGVGWLLKETYPKKPDMVVAFVEEVKPPRLVVRYAAEKMTPEDKARFGLGAKRRRAS